MSDRYHYVFSGWSDWKPYKRSDGQTTCDKVRTKNFGCYKGNYGAYIQECQKAIGPVPRVEEYNLSGCKWIEVLPDYKRYCTCDKKNSNIDIPKVYNCYSAFGDAACGKRPTGKTKCLPIMFKDCPNK